MRIIAMLLYVYMFFMIGCGVPRPHPDVKVHSQDVTTQQVLDQKFQNQKRRLLKTNNYEVEEVFQLDADLRAYNRTWRDIDIGQATVVSLYQTGYRNSIRKAVDTLLKDPGNHDVARRLRLLLANHYLVRLEDSVSKKRAQAVEKILYP